MSGNWCVLLDTRKADWNPPVEISESRCPYCGANMELFKPKPIAPLPFTSRRFAKCPICDQPFFDHESQP